MKILKADLTPERLREVIAYDPESGSFSWKAKVGRSTRIGQPAGCRVKNGHKYITLFGTDYTAQQLAWFHVHGVWPMKLKFLNGDKGDHRIANLQEYRTIPRLGIDRLTPEGKLAYRLAYQRAHQVAHKDHYRNGRLYSGFRITLTEFNERLSAQDGVCAICKQPETMIRWGKETPLAIDHDHATGKVRGLLCSSCNNGIGRFKDDENTLQRAITYLRRTAGTVPPTPEPRSAYAGFC